MSVGEITHAEVVPGEPVIVDGTQKILKRLVLTDADRRRWEKSMWFVESEPCSPSREKSSVLDPLFTATPTQLERFEQDDIEIRWPELGVVCAKTEPFWFFNFDLIKTEEEAKKWDWYFRLQVELAEMKEELEIVNLRLGDKKSENYFRDLPIVRSEKERLEAGIIDKQSEINVGWPTNDRSANTDTAGTKKAPTEPANPPSQRKTNTAVANQARSVKAITRKAAVLAAVNYILKIDEQWKTDGIPYGKHAVVEAIKKGHNSMGLTDAYSVAIRDDDTDTGIITDLETLAREGHFFFKGGNPTHLMPLHKVISQRKTDGSRTK